VNASAASGGAVGEAGQAAIAQGRQGGRAARNRGAFSSFIELMKLRMVLNIVFTTFVGYHLGSRVDYDFPLLWHTLLGTAILAMGAFALNQAMEKEYDKRMDRTRGRPIPTERVGQGAAFAFGILCLAAGTAHLWIRVNALTAILGALTLILYAAVYTPMKRYTSLNTLVGGIPGALPPLMGWTAAQDSMGLGGLVLAAILFFWQMPHFLALAWMYKNDYAQGGFKMLSVTDPTGETLFRHAVLQTLILILVSLFPFFFGIAGTWYLMTALIAGGYFLLSAVSLTRRGTREAARNLFIVSLLYLPVVLIVLAFDKTLQFV
jgi:protoheme IX farnesyltransferase